MNRSDLPNDTPRGRGAPTIDDAIRSLPEILERLTRIEEQNTELRTALQLAGAKLDRPVYDVNGLMELGYGRDEAYKIMRTYGNKRNRRLRITQDRLMDYQRAVQN